MTDPNEQAQQQATTEGMPDPVLDALKASDPEFARMMSDEVKLTMGAAADKAIEMLLAEQAQPRGVLNQYTCNVCHGQITTIDRDNGTTPFMLNCKATEGCEGAMQSSFYRCDPSSTPTFEWRKATPEEYVAESQPMRDHFDMGGLDIHAIVPPPRPPQPAPPRYVETHEEAAMLNQYRSAEQGYLNVGDLWPS